MRNLMLISLALYLCTFFVARGWSNAGLLDGVPCLPRLRAASARRCSIRGWRGTHRAELEHSSEVGTGSREENA